MFPEAINDQIPVIIENGVKEGHRTLFVVVGDRAKDQVMILSHILTKIQNKPQSPILWCHKGNLGFDGKLRKRMKQLQRKIHSGKLNLTEDDPFDLFLMSANIRFCYYSDTQKILGRTFSMCVLQDFEALTPNILARTIETVEGGGLILILIKGMLKDLYTMRMDVHQKFETEAHQNVKCRFNERFLLSLATCDRCVMVDDQLTPLPIAHNTLNVEPAAFVKQEHDLTALKTTDNIEQSLVDCCKTTDQARALLQFVALVRDKYSNSTASLTAARGRGKSATLGLAVAAAVTFGYSNIFVTSPSPENLNTFFDFVVKGLAALNYARQDYTVDRSSNPDLNGAAIRIDVRKNHRQVIQYIEPGEAHKLSHAELVIVDEAAAISLPYVKSFLGPYLVFLASTINGYEGTGRSLSLKLLEQIRTRAALSQGPGLREITLDEPIRYKSGDAVEQWLTKLLCLDATSGAPPISKFPAPTDCNLYYINRDCLFSYHKASEEFLQRLVSLYVASHYKNTPNDLQLLADAPSHHIFCLLGPLDTDHKILPEVLVIIQLCLEGDLSQNSIAHGLSRGKKAPGDLIPWTVGQQFLDQDFPTLRGARVVRIATHPNCQGMGYGARALAQLQQYYSSTALSATTTYDKSSDEDDASILNYIQPRRTVPPLLTKLSERPPEKLHYLGVSYGLTEQLFKFWKKAQFVPVYLRQTSNDLTGEHSCIMINALNEQQWLHRYWVDFRRRFINLMSYEFRKFPSSLALSILTNNIKARSRSLKPAELSSYITADDVKRLDMYSNNLIDYHQIIDLLPNLARLYFLNLIGDFQLSALQSVIMLALGLQHKSVDFLAGEVDVPSSQLMGLFNRVVRKFVQYFKTVVGNEDDQLSGKKRYLTCDSDDKSNQKSKKSKKKAKQ